MICAAKFVIVIKLRMTIFARCVWQEFVTDRLYNCTDPAWLDFFESRNWVHSHNGQAVAFVPVITGGSMSDPDTIQRGLERLLAFGICGIRSSQFQESSAFYSHGFAGVRRLSTE